MLHGHGESGRPLLLLCSTYKMVDGEQLNGDFVPNAYLCPHRAAARQRISVLPMSAMLLDCVGVP